MGNTGIGHGKVPELHWHMRDRGHHGNVSLESNDADSSFSNAVGMLVARCGEFKAVSVSCGKRGKFVGLVCGLWVVPDEAINPGGIVVPLGREIKEGSDACAELGSGTVLSVYRIVLT